MQRAPGELLMHARYMAWATRTVAAANRAWRARSGHAFNLFTRRDLDGHLFWWAVSEGLIERNEYEPVYPHSFRLARILDVHRWALTEEARTFWRLRLQSFRRAPV